MPAKNQCSHEDSRLTCVECGNAICSNCLVQCPVGFRCPTCSGVGAKRSVSAKSANALIVIRALITCGVLGYVFGIAEPFIDLPFVGVFICLAAGMMAGRLALPIVNDHRIGNAVTVTIVFGLLIGMSFTNLAVILNVILNGIIHALTSRPDQIVPALTAFLSTLFNPVAFILGFWRMSAWRY